jgi:ribosome-binding protein aMBF1 (putative translation factor)
LEVIDHGQTLRLGAYEAATSAILYSFDAEYRRRAKKKALKQDNSFGGALRRLRLEKDLTREDFQDISAKEIARIESGKVTKPHEATLKKLAKVLKVHPDEIQTY